MDFRIVMNSLKEELKHVRPDMKWRIAREFMHLGHSANRKREYSIANECYLESLNIFKELNNTYAMANILAFMGVNEEEAGNESRAKTLFDESNKLRQNIDNEVDKKGIDANE